MGRRDTDQDQILEPAVYHAGGRWPFLVKLYDSIPGPRWIGFSLLPALLESGLFVGGVSLAIVAWAFGLPIDTGLPSILALAGSPLTLQFIWHLLHLSPSDIVNLRWKSAFENTRGKITAAAIVIGSLVLLSAVLGDFFGGAIIPGGHRGRQERQAQSGQSDQLRPSRGRAGAKSPFVLHGEPPVWGLSNCQIRASPRSRLYVIEKAHVTREYLDPGRGQVSSAEVACARMTSP